MPLRERRKSSPPEFSQPTSSSQLKWSPNSSRKIKTFSTKMLWVKLELSGHQWVRKIRSLMMISLRKIRKGKSHFWHNRYEKQEAEIKSKGYYTNKDGTRSDAQVADKKRKSSKSAKKGTKKPASEAAKGKKRVSKSKGKSASKSKSAAKQKKVEESEEKEELEMSGDAESDWAQIRIFN